MESPITLTADNAEDLNKQIDIKLTQGYQLKGGMQAGEDKQLVQVMVQPKNIDSEVTLKGIIKFSIFLVIYIIIFRNIT